MTDKTVSHKIMFFDMVYIISVTVFGRVVVACISMGVVAVAIVYEAV